MNQKELQLLGEKILEQANINEPYLKAKKILKHILKQNDSQLVINSLENVNAQKIKQYEECIKKLIEERPLQYITNSQEFMGLNFYVDENVLIPQPDTEILVEKAIQMIKEKSQEQTILVLDLCTGSGAIAISLAKYVNNIKIIASDISKKALEVAKKNAISNNVEEKIQFIMSNMFENIPKMQFDYIISNPPYIETQKILNLPNEVKQEPHIALDGGKDGLEFYRNILKNANEYLKLDGKILLEIGYDQGKNIINLVNISDFELITKKPIKDLGGNDRVVVLQNKSR